MTDKMKIGILTGGGDCPGLNAVIRAVVRTGIEEYGMEVVGFLDGYDGLIENRHILLKPVDVSGILTRGGTILGTSNRIDPFHVPQLQGDSYVYLDQSSQVIRNFESLGLDVLIAIGGDGTMAVSQKLIEKGLNVIGVPKTIDNDLWGTDQTFGFDSAVASATDAIDKIHSTAQSHHRVMIVEVMGRYAGWLALASGIAGGGDVIIIPEIPYRLEAVCEMIKQRSRRGKNFSIVVIGEGSREEGGEMVVRKFIEDSPERVRLGGVSNQLADQIEEKISMQARVTILGHLLRGGTPTPFDRILASRFGIEAVHMASERKFGYMVALKGSEITSVPISEVAGKIRRVEPDSPLLKTAVALGTCLGIENIESFRAEEITA